jgi:type I pantothenate kinase
MLLPVDAAAVVAEEVERRGSALVGITGGVAVGKSTLAAAVAEAIGAEVVATDGFLHPNATLAALDLSHRKGFPESFDAAVMQAFLDGWRASGTGEVPVYSHLAYDVVGATSVAAERLVLEGLHLGHPDLGIRDRLDLLVHLEVADDDAARWYLGRFQALRALAAADPGAFLHQFRDVPAEVLDGMAMDVWRDVNLVVLEEAVRPWSDAADLVLVLGPDHEVEHVLRPRGR